MTNKHNTWTRSDGSKIALDEMNEHHLRNALRKSLERISVLEKELKEKKSALNNIGFVQQ
jgi:hypothetical protein